MSGTRSAHEEVPVLIVGGSLVGLSMAMFLSWHGVESLTVEHHSGTAIHPRAAQFSQRTMEIFRELGLEDIIREKSYAQFTQDGAIMAVESLAGKELEWYIRNLNEAIRDISPTIRLFLTQNVLEPILRAKAEELGARLSFNTDMTELRPDGDGATAIIRPRDGGAERTIRARYVVAADGNRSPIRDQLGIAMRGHGVMSNSVTIYFRANCGPLLRDRALSVIYVYNESLRGFFRLEKSGESGFLVVNTAGDTSRPEAANVAEGITEERCVELVRAAIGVPDMAIGIQNVAPWRAVAETAETFRAGNIFLAGDAAHVMPPNGGFGGNTGIQDAHNLAWKLALVLGGNAGPGLLDSYDAERRPAAGRTVEQAYSRYVLRTAPYLGTDGMQPPIDDLNIELGYRYASSAVIGEPADDPGGHEHPRESHGRPGTRAPHLWLDRAGQQVSTHDLFGRRFVLLTGGDKASEGWRNAAREAQAKFGVEIDVWRIGRGADLIESENEGGFPAAFGIGSSGASLVRPDGIVGWRSGAIGTDAGLVAVMGTILSRN
jgi:2-polyprenyl-6-methoxyphenol hydroxylase-like FAD-dependent oxidoreductase